MTDTSTLPDDAVLLDTFEAAKLLCMSHDNLYRLSYPKYQGEDGIPCTRIGCRNRYRLSDLKSWIAARTATAPNEGKA